MQKKNVSERVNDLMFHYDLEEVNERCDDNIRGALLDAMNDAQARKANYWRGFIACSLFIVVPLLVAYVVFCHHIIAMLGY